jgi:DNA adenine methylase
MARTSAARSLPSPAPADDDARPRPFVKWAGGKRQLWDQLQPLLPANFKRYYEPFAGGAAVFFALGRTDAVLADMNAELMNVYTAVRDEVDGVIAELQKYRYGATHYYRAREANLGKMTSPQRAARTIYLNRTGYNGLYRVNRAGKFNVPMGRHTNPTLCDGENLRACARALQGVDLRVQDFEAAAGGARAGDLVYFDPPYVPVSDTADFTSYVPGGFGADEQRRLADLFARLAGRGVHVVLSNSDTPTVRKLYAGFRIQKVMAARFINSRGSRRGKVGEVVVTSA